VSGPAPEGRRPEGLPERGGAEGGAARPDADGPVAPPAGGRDETTRSRPLVERIGLFAIALVLAALFGGIAAALVGGGELFLGIMAGVGCAMTLWVGGLTLLRG
jgi:hypothetical protein